MFYRNFTALAVASLFMCTSYAMKEEKAYNLSLKKKLAHHIGEHSSQLVLDTGIGSVAGMAEVIGGGQFQFALKNHIQQGKKLSLKSLMPAEWLPGISINILAMVPTTAVQVGANGVLNSLYPAECVKEKLQHAFCAGALSGLVSGPAEQTIIYQLINKCNFKTALKQLYTHGIFKTLFKPNATMFAMGRDGIFAPGFLILPELYQRYLNVPAAASTLSAGVTVALLTHPLDRIKTALQVDMTGTYRNALDATIQLWKKGGIKELYAGGLWRGTRVCTAITIMSAICNKCHELID